MDNKKDKILIPKKQHLKGEDGYKVFSIRIKEETAASLDELATQTGRSRNEIINMFLEYGIENYVIVEDEVQD